MCEIDPFKQQFFSAIFCIRVGFVISYNITAIILNEFAGNFENLWINVKIPFL